MTTPFDAPATADDAAGVGMIDPNNKGYNAATARLFNPHAPGDTKRSNRLFNPDSNPNTWDTELTSTDGAARDPNAGYGVAGSNAAYGRAGAVGSVWDATRIGMQQAQFDPNYRNIVSAFRQGRPTVAGPQAPRSNVIVNDAMSRL